MPLMEVNPVEKIKKGSGGLGGLLGKVGGAIAGGVGGALIGGPAGILPGIGVGSTVGNIGGSMADKPDSISASRPVAQIHAAAALPEVQFATLNDAKKSVYELPDLSSPQKDQLASIYSSAQEALQKSLQMRRV
jgi:hypothetical protein